MSRRPCVNLMRMLSDRWPPSRNSGTGICFSPLCPYSVKSFGKKSTPTRIDLCKNELQELLRQNLDQLPEDVHSIYQLSCYLLPRLKECGYSGSERTLRNYLHTNPSVKAIFEKGISTHDQDQEHE